MRSLMFYIFSTILIIGAVRVILARNPVHSVLFLVLVFFNSAGLFLLAGAEFLAMMQIIVYVGAVAVLFLFVVMMLDIPSLDEGILHYFPLGGLIGLVLLTELVIIITAWLTEPGITDLLSRKAGTQPISAVIAGSSIMPTEPTNTEALGHILYTDYLYPFQMSGMLLLVAMLGAIVLTLRSRPGTRKQNAALQQERTKVNSLEIKKVLAKEGV